MKHVSSFSAAVVLCAAASILAQPAPGYRLVKQIPIGGAGGWDYLSVDPEAHRLYVSHATKVVVIDTEKDAVVGEIADTPGIHGLAVAADLGRGFTSNGRENKVSIVDLKTLQTVQKVDVGQNPDAIMYEPSRHEVYVMNGRSNDASVLDARSGTVVATIPLGGKPESAASDGTRVYINLEDKSAIAVVDLAAHKLAATWPLAPGEEPTGIAIDRDSQRLFVGCGNKLMLMVDAQSGRVQGSVPAGDGIDATWFDPGTKLAFSSSRDGAITIGRVDGGKFVKVETVKTAVGSRTMALDPKTHRLYLAAVDYAPAAAAPAGGQPARPQVKPETFRVLVFAGPA